MLGGSVGQPSTRRYGLGNCDWGVPGGCRCWPFKATDKVAIMTAARVNLLHPNALVIWILFGSTRGFDLDREILPHVHVWSSVW
jgi:hypothetical protein